MNPPKLLTNWVQFVTRIGVLTGPVSANPTNAATAVPTPSIGFEPEDTSSMKTPGDKYVGTAGLPFFDSSMQRQRPCPGPRARVPFAYYRGRRGRARAEASGPLF